MFDYYITDPPLACPRCSENLTGWQGKDGLNLLNHWRQKSRHPINTDWDEEDIVGTKEDYLSSQIHPDGEFLIYTDCSSCGLDPIYAKASVREGLWESCALVSSEDVDKIFYYLPKAERTAIKAALEKRD